MAQRLNRVWLISKPHNPNVTAALYDNHFNRGGIGVLGAVSMKPFEDGIIYISTYVYVAPEISQPEMEVRHRENWNGYNRRSHPAMIPTSAMTYIQMNLAFSFLTVSKGAVKGQGTLPTQTTEMKEAQ